MAQQSIVSTFLWFDGQAEEAATFYTSLIPDSAITDVSRDGEGKAFVVSFTLDGQQFIALNGGPEYSFTDAVSIYVSRKDQAEVDSLWDVLTSDGGKAGPCGWLKDRFGLSWQVVPEELPRLLTDPNPAKAEAVMTALRGMSKLDVQGLRDAHASA